MQKRRMLCLLLSLVFLLHSALQIVVFASNEEEQNVTNFITDEYDFDEILQRPYNDDVPLGFSDNIFALYSDGWGFSRIYRTGLSTEYNMNIDLKVDGILAEPSSGTYKPSHISLKSDQGASSAVISSNPSNAGFPKATASYTSVWGKESALNDGIIDYKNNWTNYVDQARAETEWVEIDFGEDNSQSIDAVKLYILDDGGNSKPPSKIEIKYWSEDGFVDCENIVSNPLNISANENTYSFDNIETTKIRAYLTPAQGKCITLSEFQVLSKIESNSNIQGYKYITKDDIAVSVIEITNENDEDMQIDIVASSNSISTADGEQLIGKVDNFNVRLAGQEFVEENGKLATSVLLSPGESKTFKLGLAFSPSSNDSNQTNIDKIYNDDNYIKTQNQEFNEWYRQNIPYFDSPDSTLNQIYYFRWLTYRNNIRKTSDGSYIITEFLPNVPWAGKHNAISCPAGHHFYEGRWIKDSKYLDGYANYWLKDGNPTLYSFWISDAYYSRYLVDNDVSKLTGYLPDLVDVYGRWDYRYVSDFGLYYQIADRDGMEMPIGGDGIRPTINSYMYGDAAAISKIAALATDEEIESEFETKAESIKINMEQLWDNDFYKVMHTNGNIADVRELIGYVPWYFNIPSEEKSVAWAQMIDDEGFNAKYGPTTAEQRHPRFMAGTGHDCLWDGPSWPFATTQALTAMANLLNNYSQSYVDEADYFNALKTFAKSHYKTNSLDGEKYPWLAEDLDPFTGEWIADFQRSVNYNHSAFIDLVITGLVGLRPDSGNVLEINPLIPQGEWDYFALENVSYHGHNISIVYDKDGSRYNGAKGFSIYVDGVLEKNTEDYQDVEIQLQQLPTPNPIPNKALNNSPLYPKAIYSYQNENDRAIYANDGVISYTSYNHWSNKGSKNNEDYLGVDFGKSQTVNKIKLYLLQDDNYNLPQNLKLQYLNNETWENIDCNVPEIALGENSIDFSDLETDAVRILISGTSVAITEFEVIYSQPESIEGENIAQGVEVIASYTSQWDNLSQINDGIISYGDNPRSRWTNYDSIARTEEEQIEFKFAPLDSTKLKNAKIYFYADSSNVALPENYKIEFFDKDGNSKVVTDYIVPTQNENTINIENTIDNLDRMVIYLNPAPSKSIGITEVELFTSAGEIMKDKVISQNPSAKEYPEASSTYTYKNDSIDSVNDGIISYNDSPRNRWSNYAPDYRESGDIKIDFGRDEDIDSLNVYFFTDDNCKLPEQAKILYWDGTQSEFVDVENLSLTPNFDDANKWRYDFDTIKTSKIMIDMIAQDDKTLAITEIEAFRKSAKIKTIASIFDKNPNEDAQDLFNDIVWNEAKKINEIYANGELLSAENYKLHGDILMLDKAYLAEQETGDIEFKIIFDKMNAIIWKVNIFDTSKEKEFAKISFHCQAEEIETLSQASNNVLDVEIDFNEEMLEQAQGVDVCLALYDESGRLILSHGYFDNTDGSYAIDIPEYERNMALKVFIWDNEIMPLIDATILQ